MRLGSWAVGLLVAAGCAGPSANAPAPAAAAATEARPTTEPELSPTERVDRGIERTAKSDYAAAGSDLEPASRSEDPAVALRANLALLELNTLTGRYRAVARDGSRLAKRTDLHGRRAAVLAARAFASLGQLEPAQELLTPLAADRPADDVQLALAEIWLSTGQRQRAEELLMMFVEDYNAQPSASADAMALARVGRAAVLLRAPRDANDAFNEAERAQAGVVNTLLWRAELFLDKYDAKNARQVLNEILEGAPHHPDALALLAQVQLDEAYDFARAEALAKEALRSNPNSYRALSVLAGIAIRESEYAAAERYIQEGLDVSPRQLTLLSQRAAIFYVTDRRKEYEHVRARVFELNPNYARFYQIVGATMEWAHRYPEIIELMRTATTIDPDDAKIQAALGLNLLRAGEEEEAIHVLQRAFALDPFHVRAFNTLNLYERQIPDEYVTVADGPFRFRFPKADAALLRRYIPRLAKEAYATFTRDYGFEPEGPLYVEIYADRPSFGIRVSGYPRIALHGVCFGKTLATISPVVEPFNLSMTLWHEIAHVFHIQSTGGRVPRWFAEGMAELETHKRRPEWRREQSRAVHRALREGRIPHVNGLSRAFTRVDKIEDITMAYAAMNELVAMIEADHGYPALIQMLALWRKGHSDSEVFELALGATADEVQERFTAYLGKKLERFDRQYSPPRVTSVALAWARVEQKPDDGEGYVVLGLAAVEERDAELARDALASATEHGAEPADLLWLRARMARAAGDAKGEVAGYRALAKSGADGYELQMLLAANALLHNDDAALADHAKRAHAFDSEQSQPLRVLATHARRKDDSVLELWAVSRLAGLEQHSPDPHRRLLELYTEAGEFDELRRAGPAAVQADLAGTQTHLLYADALLEARDFKAAAFEYETAAALSSSNDLHALRAHRGLAAALKALGKAGKAREHERAARTVEKALSKARPSRGSKSEQPSPEH